MFVFFSFCSCCDKTHLAHLVAATIEEDVVSKNNWYLVNYTCVQIHHFYNSRTIMNKIQAIQFPA
jgi:hypothetical protein